jgi:hypothetical protein
MGLDFLKFFAYLCTSSWQLIKVVLRIPSARKNGGTDPGEGLKYHQIYFKPAD